MKFQSAFILCAILSSSAFAGGPIETCGQNTSCPSATDYAAQVKALFDAGSKPDNLVPGDYTGRCYAVPVGNPPQTGGHSVSGQGAYLAITNLDENANQGPLFPDTSQIGFGVFTGQGYALDAFDNGENVDPDLSEILPACVQNGDLIALAPSTVNDPSDYTGTQGYVLRKNGDYLVIKSEVTVDVSSVGIKAGDAFGYCYFFKKVK